MEESLFVDLLDRFVDDARIVFLVGGRRSSVGSGASDAAAAAAFASASALYQILFAKNYPPPMPLARV